MTCSTDITSRQLNLLTSTYSYRLNCVSIRRFDTDDFCEAQCDFLQKVHFHCLVEDCGALFSTVDGAIKHAK